MPRFPSRAARRRVTNGDVVVCAGGHGKMKSKMGDAVVAFRLE